MLRSIQAEIRCFGLIAVFLTSTGCAQSGIDGSVTPKDNASPPAKSSFDREQDLRGLMDKERVALEERQTRIDAELAALDRTTLKDDDWAKQWAGSYYTGDGLGMNVRIRLAPKSGITYTWHGCMGLYDANHGDIVEAFPGGLKVKLAIEEKASLYHFMSTTLYFVRWGDRRYLVPESQMLDLVNSYNEGGYARRAMHSIPKWYEGQVTRYREEAPPGRPELPAKYAKLIIENPLHLKITKVTTQPERDVTKGVRASESKIELEGGLDQGVFVGMEISYKSGLGLSSGTIKIDRVDDKTSSGTLTMFGGSSEKFIVPQVGFELSFPGASPDVPAAEIKSAATDKPAPAEKPKK